MKMKKIIIGMAKVQRLYIQMQTHLSFRDRDGSFEPQKKDRHPELEAKILSMFASGMSYKDRILKKFMTTRYRQQKYQ
ncbi:hypothetical protein [Candidatus Mesenet endosymbiont of Phosphuga atrata]|uniref:hypothetical protein n=1 Tax=Candidatus Mesenet endosymbiont of Phosphuga atrata TaxID=3066221 RepID=UPI003977A6E6